MAGGAADFFQLDRARCVKCGACVRDCAFKALKADAEGAPVVAAPERCMRCQHCLAICPTGAVALDGHVAADCPSAESAELPTPKAVVDWMSFRRSIRSFRDEDVDPAVLDRILRVLGNSPTGCNARALTFTCFPNRKSMADLRGRFLSAVAAPRPKLLPRWLAVPAIKLRRGESDMFFRGASGLLLVSSDVSTPGVATPKEDVVIACSNFELLANAHGIATCWCGFMNLVQAEVPGLTEAIAGFPRTHPFAAILFGLPAVRYPRGVCREDSAKIIYH